MALATGMLAAVQAPGWYPDPSGQPQSFRFWDGQTWTPVTTANPNTPWPTPQDLARPGLQPLGGSGTPGGPGSYAGAGQPPSGPGGPAPVRPKTPLIIGIAALAVVALVIAGGLWFTRGNTPAPSPTSSPTTAPESPAATAPAGSAKLDCGNGNGNQTSQQAASYSSTGLRYDAPPSFTFRFDKSYWTWADDYSAWGRGKEEVGVVLGGLRAENGFTDLAAAGPQTLECLVGSLSTQGKVTAEGAQTAPVTVAGMSAQRTTARLVSASESVPLLVTITVIDSGQPGKFGHMITFMRGEDNPARAEVEQAAGSLRRG